MECVKVSLGVRSYPVVIGAGAITASQLRDAIRGPQVAVITNETVGPLYLPPLLKALDGLNVSTLQLPDGERHKNLATYGQVIDFLMHEKHNRTTTIVALGGGVIGDLAGFAAATYQRGVRFVQVPTTLLAQVDSSVGGKTAVNHPAGKNMIGAFYQPAAVLADTDSLRTLPEREFRAGLAEIVKYGVIRDEALFSYLESATDALLSRDETALTYVIRRSVEIKADVVAQDEREAGLREILNFGHTFGHALEALTSYEDYLHGEAVAVGMLMAAAASRTVGRFDPEAERRLRRLNERLGLPETIPGKLSPELMLDAMAMDKKVRDGRLRLILADRLGSVRTVELEDRAVLLPVLEAFRG